jgi:hypothetical protein
LMAGVSIAAWVTSRRSAANMTCSSWVRTY